MPELRQDAAGDQPVEAHADGGEVLFYRWFGHPSAEHLDVAATWSGSMSTSWPILC